MFYSRAFAAALPLFFASTVLSLDLPTYTALQTFQKDGILEVTLHNPASQINVWSEATQNDLIDLVQRLQGDNKTKVVLFKSDVPKFFTAHVDPLMPGPDTFPTRFATLLHNIATLPQVTIGAVEGIARAAGNELLVSLDMRFATKRSVLGQPEVGLGLFPSGGGSLNLPRLIGRGLAMEYVLSSNDIDAREAERIGWINKAFDSSADMYRYIDKLTARLRLFQFESLSTAKASVNRASLPSLDDILKDVPIWGQRLGDPNVQALVGKFLALTNNAILGPAELDLAQALVKLYT